MRHVVVRGSTSTGNVVLERHVRGAPLAFRHGSTSPASQCRSPSSHATATSTVAVWLSKEREVTLTVESGFILVTEVAYAAGGTSVAWSIDEGAAVNVDVSAVVAPSERAQHAYSSAGALACEEKKKV